MITDIVPQPGVTGDAPDPDTLTARALASRHAVRIGEWRGNVEGNFLWLYDDIWSRRADLGISGRAFAKFIRHEIPASVGHVLRRMNAIEVHDQVLGRSQPMYPELVYREMVSLPNDERSEVWQEAWNTRPWDHRRTYGKRSKVMTGEHVKRTIRRLYPDRTVPDDAGVIVQRLMRQAMEYGVTDKLRKALDDIGAQK